MIDRLRRLTITHPALLFTQCLQNDFVQLVGRYEPLPNSLHIGHEEARRLLGDHPADGVLQRLIDWAYTLPDDELRLIHIRDWHDASDPAQAAHLQQFGAHCLRGEAGAGFVFREPEGSGKQVKLINSLTLNDFEGTELLAALSPFKGRRLRVGLTGVWTEAKIMFLAYELTTRFPEFSLGVCSALTASSSRAHHFMALDQLSKLLGVSVFPSVGDFVRFLGGEQAMLRLPQPVNADYPAIEIDSAQPVSETDRNLIRYLFRDCKTAKFKCLDGGFSGNLVLGSQSTDLFGQAQVPHVVKIGKQELIGQERAAFEQVEPVLGNNAPHIAEFADFQDRGAIKYRYAAMGRGTSLTFQKRYLAGMPQAKVDKILTTVFAEQLGRFYQAASREKCNLLDYYSFRPDMADQVRARVEAVLGGPADGAWLRLPVGPEFPNPSLFYENDLSGLLPLAEGSSYFAFVHGDLNGANIIVDAQENVWLIDFFHTHRGHVLQDLLKFENDLLYIMTPLASDQELRAALEATNQLMQIEDLAKPLADPQHAGGWPEALRHAWKTLQTLRSFYPALIQSDRSPLQAWIGQMRYAMHTLSFDEASPRQKAWALYTAGHCAARITEQSRKNGPLRVDWIQDSLVAPGRLGLTILPGRRDLKRHLPTDLEALKGAGVTHVLCLLPDMELRHYGVGTLMQAYAQAGFKARQAPMVDQKTTSVEDMREVTAWTGAALAEGGRVTVHCTGGLGRSGMVAACCLKIKGLSSDQAIAEVRRVRSQRAIETAAQEEFIRAFMPS